MPERGGEIVVLLTTWNRPALLRTSLAQIEREAASIGAPLVICDDHSDDSQTRALLDGAAGRGAELIRRPYQRMGQPAAEAAVHLPLRDALRELLASAEGRELVRRCAQEGFGEQELQAALVALRRRHLVEVHVHAQRNNLFGFRHVLRRHPRAGRILKIDDDVVLRDGAFAAMCEAWSRAARDGHDVLTVSGLLTSHQAVLERGDGYSITRGICNVAVLYARGDWEQFLQHTPQALVERGGFDLAFAERFAPRHRVGAVPVAVTPSVVSHRGRNGMHVYDAEIDVDFDEAPAQPRS